MMRRLALLMPLAAAGIALAACSSGTAFSPSPTSPEAPTSNVPGVDSSNAQPCPWSTSAMAGTQACADARTMSAPTLTADSFTVDLKTLSQHCFGSAGCNVKVEPKLTYKDGSASDLDGTSCQITYEITGGESPVIETISSTGSQFSSTPSLLQTSSSAAKLSAAVQDVSCQ